MEPFGAFKQDDPRSGSRSQDILEDTTYNDGYRYEVGMVWADDRSSLSNNNFSTLMQLTSVERLIAKNPERKSSYEHTITNDSEKGYIVKAEKRTVLKMIVLVKSTYRTTKLCDLTNPAKSDVCA